jgi:hypothetical protein
MAPARELPCKELLGELTEKLEVKTIDSSHGGTAAGRTLRQPSSLPISRPHGLKVNFTRGSRNHRVLTKTFMTKRLGLIFLSSIFLSRRLFSVHIFTKTFMTKSLGGRQFTEASLPQVVACFQQKDLAAQKVRRVAKSWGLTGDSQGFAAKRHEGECLGDGSN